jgi:hypothetical protein
MMRDANSAELTVEQILEARRVEARKQLAAQRVIRQFEQGLLTVRDLIDELDIIDVRGE